MNLNISVNGKTFSLTQANINNKTDVELAKFCADSDDPVVRELAYRLGNVADWNPDDPVNNHCNRAEMSGGKVNIKVV